MKVIFLDYDGVINLAGPNAPASAFSKAACSNVKKLLNEVKDLKIVISSSWRHRGLDFVKSVLDQVGIGSDRVIGITPEDAHSRLHHIKEWLNNNKEVANFVILDDDGGLPEHAPHLVKVNPYIGVTGSDVEKAKKILKV